jgi:hypothetical protein
MSHELTLDLPEEIYLPLLRQAEEAGQPLEALIRDYLAQAARASSPPGLLRRWAGAFASDVPDAATRHHEYLGETLHDELLGKPDD